MDIKDLKSISYNSKKESIAKASRILYMTPQGISKIVKNPGGRDGMPSLHVINPACSSQKAEDVFRICG